VDYISQKETRLQLKQTEQLFCGDTIDNACWWFFNAFVEFNCEPVSIGTLSMPHGLYHIECYLRVYKCSHVEDANHTVNSLFIGSYV